MKEIIKEVLQAEENAGAILQQARERAAEMIRTVDKENAEKIREAQGRAQEIIRTTVDEARQEGEQLREEKLKQAAGEKDNLLHDKMEAITHLVDRVCAVILATEFEEDA